MLTRIRYKERMERLAWEERGEILDLRLDDMETAKHVAEAVGLATPGQLDKEGGMATVQTVRVKMRRLFSQWERKTDRKMPQEIHDSMAPVSTSTRPVHIEVLADHVVC
jgi:hypothetical protein